MLPTAIWWADETAEPHPYGPICRHCRRVIDWHPVAHWRLCPARPENPTPTQERGI